MNPQGSLPLPPPVTIVVVSGAIGVGKSTLLDVLRDAGYNVLPEPVDLWRERGWLQEFYEDQRGKAFWFQQAVYASSIENVEKKLADIAAENCQETFEFYDETTGLFQAPLSNFFSTNSTGLPAHGEAIADAMSGFPRSTLENATLGSACASPRSHVLFVERYIYDQLCFWQTNVLMGNGSRAEDDVYMSFWQRWRRFIPEPKGKHNKRALFERHC